MIKKLLGDKDHLGRRYLIFLVGLCICSFGVAFTTKAGLGTSPVSAIPYTLSMIFPGLTFGSWLIIFGFLQIGIQIILLRKNCVVSELVVQGILAFAFGYLTDLSMLLLSGLNPELYIMKIVYLVLGCFILAFGVYMELLGDVGMLSNDAFIKAIAFVFGKEYGNVKIVVDVAMLVVSAAMGLVCIQRIAGVREGSIIAALIVGLIIKFYKKIFNKAEKKIFG